MIKNYFTIGWRNISKRKGYSFINVGGLTVGIAACLLLFTVVKYELSYDTHHPSYNRIHRVVTQDNFSDGIDYTPGIPFPALNAIKIFFPECTTGALFASYGSQVTILESNAANTSSNKKFIEETGFFFCNPEFFKVFHFTWLTGSPAILNEPNTTVLTQKMAQKYFGSWKNALGKFIKLDNAVIVRVEGILQDPPANSDFPLGIVTSYVTAKANPNIWGYNPDWGNTTSNFQLYLLLPENVSAAHIDKQLAQFSKQNYKQDQASKKTSFLQPLSQIHFDNRFGNFGDHTISKSTLWTLSLIGVFIVIMACINFINLATAQAMGRSKEVGIRKVLGSNRFQLLGQVMGETFFIVVLAMVLAVIIGSVCVPFIKHITSIKEQLNLIDWQTVSFLLGLVIVVTLLAGLYPALIVSGFNPALALKNKITSATVGKTSLRKGLVVTQFAISQVLIIGTIVAIGQMNYIHSADLGFNKEAILIINTNSDSAVQSRQDAFKNKLLQLPGVQSVSFSSDVPSSDNNWSGNFSFDHRPDEKFDVYRKAGDEDYFKTYGLEIIAGRIFEKSDTAKEIVINETLVKKLGVKNAADVVGKEIRSGRGGWKTIVGVVKDFNTNSLREDVKPLMLFQRKDRYGVTGIKVKSTNIPKTKAAIEAAWNQYFPEYAYTSSYMDEDIARFYEQEDKLSLLYKIFAAIAIFISCLGLYGLVSFMAMQRTKEIGVRKVLGGTIGHILWIFGKEFFILLMVAFVISAPIAWWMMTNWLQNFEFRVPISPWIFVLSILISIVVAALTVGYRSVRAAIVNPIKSLRTE
jgi:putative ABC transport system permease protein